MAVKSTITWVITRSATWATRYVRPKKPFPAAVPISIVVVATIYMLMNLAFIGVVPWQETLQDGTMANKNIAGVFMTRLHGDRAAGSSQD